MKRYFMIFAAALFSFAACQEEIAPETETNDEGIFDYPISMTFTADNEAAVKTVINGTAVTWESGDEIKVLWSETGYNKAVANPLSGNASAEFSTKVEKADAYYAVYPYAAESSYSNGNIAVTVPSVQGGAFADANIAVAKATADNTLPFKHLVGIIEFTTDVPGKVVISGAEGDVLTGKVIVTGFGDDGLPVYEVENGSNTIEINASASGTYYAAFLPSATLKCLSIKVGEGDAAEYALSANQLQMARGKVWELGNISGRLGKNYFVSASADGNGDGKTWETAFTYQQMADFVAANRSEVSGVSGTNTDVAASGFAPAGMTAEEYRTLHNTEHAAQLNGVTFHLAAGTYSSSAYVRISFPERGEAVKMTFKGGYPAEAEGTDLSGRNPEQNVTKISGQEKRRLFFVRYYSDITFDGIVLADGWVNTNGGALLFNESQTSSVTFNNCDFINNRSTLKNSDNGNGGAVNASSSSNVGNLTFKDCCFSQNHSQKKGGVIYTKGGVHTFTNCTFQSNTTEADGGGVLYSEIATTEHTFTNCTFFGNTVTGAGGVMNVSASKVKLEGCIVGGTGENQANSCTGNGGAFQFAGANVEMINCQVANNSTGANVGGAIYSNGALTMTITDTDFIGNSAGKSGGALYHSGTGTITINKDKKDRVHIKDNSCGGQYGGAIYISNTSTWNVSGCDITGNKNTGTATDANQQYGSGAAIYNTKGTLNLTDCNITKNEAATSGAGMFIGGAATVTMTGGSISENTSAKNGAGICVKSSDVPVLTLTGVQMNSNKAVRGAAIDFEKGTWILDGCTLKSNASSTGLGGAIYANTGSMTIRNNCLFEANEATKNSAGAIYVTTNATMTIDNSTFIGNKAMMDAAYGGAVYISNTAANVTKISNCLFRDNKAEFGSAVNAHAVYKDSKYTTSTLYLSNCIFTGESTCEYTSTANNGVVYTKGQLYMNNCMFYGNIFSKANNSIVVNAASGGSDSQAVIMNTMVVEDSDNMGALVAYYDNVKPQLYNNVFVSKRPALNGGYGSLNGTIASFGYNYYTDKSMLNTSAFTADETDTDVTYSDVIGNFTLINTADGRGYCTWTAPEGISMTTLDDMTAFLNGVTGGADFAAWLGTVNGLSHDIAGNPRPTTGAIYPGCYQKQ